VANDLTGTYLSARDASYLTPSQLRRRQLASESEEPVQSDAALLSASRARENIASLAGGVGAVAADIAGGVIEAPRQIVGGVLNATKELAQFMESAIPLGTLGGKDVTEESFITADEPRTGTGALIRGISQFVTGFIPATKAIKLAGVTSKAAQVIGAGAAADALVFDPHEDRLSNLIEEFPVLKNPITGYLEADSDDGAAEGRFKNAVEGMGLGGITDGFFKAAKVLRANRIAKAEQRQLMLDQQAAERVSVIAKDVAEPTTAERLVAVDQEGLPLAEPEFKPIQAVTDEDAPLFTVGEKKAGEERALNINLNRLETTEDVEKLIEGVAEAEAKDINLERREVITNEQTEKLADELGFTVEQLLDRRRGQAFNAEQAVAARKILVASGENLINLAKVAATGTEEDILKFRRALSQHSAIQKQVSGLTAEAGRALQSFNIQAKSAKEQERLIKEALSTGGGIEGSKDLASQLSQLDDIGQINTFVKQAEKASTPAMFYEAWINGLLSSPATHVVNVLSNAIVVGWSVGERKVASMIGDAVGGQAIPEGETTSQAFGMVQGAKDGFKLAWHAIKTGEPSDPITKMENQGFRAITGDNLNLTGIAGRFADFVGEAVRVPGRLLTAGDELFKSIGYRMELHGQAYRTGFNEGLRGEELAARINNIVQNPPENLHIEAVNASRYQTFTRELGEGGKAVQQVISKNPAMRIIVPFIRTPTNIIKYVGERTVLAPLSTAVRAEMAAGGARRDLALAKIATGSMAMMVAADYSMSGNITGAGPTNPQMRNTLRATGWQPYSIKFDDTYFAYSRLDPIGAFIGLSADITEIVGQSGELDALDLTTAAMVAVGQNVTSKTYLRGLAEFFDVMSSASSDPEANNKKMKRWLSRMAGSVIPSGVAAISRTLTPELKATYGILDRIKSRIPGYSDDLPPRRNIFGEPIVLSGGLGPDIMSPIYTSTDKKNPVADEIVAQQSLIRMPHKNINGVELDPKQYDRYIQLYSGKDNKGAKGVKLQVKLSQLFRTPQYKRATEGQEGGKSLMIRATFEGYRESAKAQMMQEFPELKNDIIFNKRQKAEKLIGR